MIMDFFRRVGVVCNKIPKGKVATYGQLADLCGVPRGAREVGRALSRGAAESAHRVVNSRGYLSGANAFLFDGMQRALLEEEGVAVSDTNIVDLQQYGWNPTEDELQWLSDCFTAMGI